MPALPRRKRAVNKITWPGRKQVWRRYGADGRMAGDILSLEADKPAGEPLLKLVMQGGRRVQPPASLDDIRVMPSGNSNVCRSRCVGWSRVRPIRSRSAGCVECAAAVDRRMAREAVT